jgi:hypothetical protein
MKNLIIDFLNTNEQDKAIQLAQKLHNKGETYNYISLHGGLDTLTPEGLAMLQTVDSNAQIYIIAHGSPSATKIMGVHYQKLGDFLAEKLNDDQIHNPNSNLKVSFITCYGGRGEDSGLESYAGLFHRYIGQQHHIYSTVLARDSLTWSRGEKYTGTDIAYAISKFELASKLGYEEKHFLRHKYPGSKVSLQWNQNGEQWAVDAYIDKYFSNSEAISNLLGQLMADESLSDEDVKSIITIKREIMDFISDKQNEELSSVKYLDSALKKVRKILSQFNANQYNELRDLVNYTLTLSKSSIGLESAYPTSLQVSIHDEPVVKEKNIDDRLNQITSPILDLVEELPNTQTANRLKEAAVNVANMLSEIAKSKLEREYSDELEYNISRVIKESLLQVLFLDKPSEEKMALFNTLEPNIVDQFTKAVILSPEYDGVIEGVKAAIRLGGFFGLKNLFLLIEKRSELRSNQYTNLINQVSHLTNECRAYLEQ